MANAPIGVVHSLDEAESALLGRAGLIDMKEPRP